jgi:hypothetical protein
MIVKLLICASLLLTITTYVDSQDIAFPEAAEENPSRRNSKVIAIGGGRFSKNITKPVLLLIHQILSFLYFGVLCRSRSKSLYDLFLQVENLSTKHSERFFVQFCVAGQGLSVIFVNAKD